MVWNKLVVMMWRIPLLTCVFFSVLLSPCVLAGTEEVIVPAKRISLFNGKDMDNFYTWLVDTGRRDPEKVFSVVDSIDGAPAIRISGERWGGLVTEKSYQDYRLLIEFRWGLLTWGRRIRGARDSGILLHCQGEDGNTGEDFNGPWMRSIETQIIEGGVGDFIIVAGYDRAGNLLRPMVSARTALRKGSSYYDPNGALQEFDRGRVNWFGRDPSWNDVVGFRGEKDVESPFGEWTVIEVISRGGKITNLVNGVEVNAVVNSSLTAGRILIQSEGAELYLRKIELLPLE